MAKRKIALTEGKYYWLSSFVIEAGQPVIGRYVNEQWFIAGAPFNPGKGIKVLGRINDFRGKVPSFRMKKKAA